MNKNLIRYLAFGYAIVLIDQFTKWSIIIADAPSKITSFLSFELSFNRGISWGLLSSSSSGLFFGVSSLVAVLTGLLAFSAYQRLQKGLSIYPEAALIAGSCSNLFDRVVHGGVVDFILVHYKDYYWPVFNIADIAIVCGVIALIIRQLRTL